jgi:hypothetical protein
MTEASQHDFWMTMAQVLPVLGIAWGIEQSRGWKRRRKRRHTDRLDTPGWAALAFVNVWFPVLVLAGSFGVTMYALVFPGYVAWQVAAFVGLFVGGVGASFLTFPALDAPSKLRGEKK